MKDGKKMPQGQNQDFDSVGASLSKRLSIIVTLRSSNAKNVDDVDGTSFDVWLRLSLEVTRYTVRSS